MTRAAIIAALLAVVALPVDAHADPVGGPNTFPIYRPTDGMPERRGESRNKPPCQDMARSADERIAACRAITDGGKADSETWQALGLAYVDKGDDASAVEPLTHAIDAEWRYLPTMDRALAYARLGEYDKAMADAETFTRATKGVPQAMALRCRIRAIADKDREAGLADCDAALAKEPHQPIALNDRALLLFRLGRLAEARDAFDLAFQFGGRTPFALYMRGLIAKQSGNAATGEADMARALAVDPAAAAQLAHYRPARKNPLAVEEDAAP